MALYHTAQGSVSYTTVGSPTIVDGVVSGFTSSNYLTIGQQLDTSKPFEIVSAFKTTAIGSTQGIVGMNNKGLLQIYIRNTGQIRFSIGTDPDAWDIGEITGSTLSVNTDYMAKCVFTGTAYELYLSTNGGSAWNLEGSITSSVQVNNGSPITLNLGKTHSQGWLLEGSIDLNSTYISVNGQPWFGKCPVEVKSHQIMGAVGYTKVGSPTITDGIASGFSSSDLLRTTSAMGTFLSGLKTYEVSSTFETGTIGTAQAIIGGRYGNNTLGISITSTGKPRFTVYYKKQDSSNRTWYADIDYILSAISKYKVTATLDLNTLAVVMKLYDGLGNLLATKETELGDDFDSITSQGEFNIGYTQSGAFSGSIDLNHTYIKVNGKLWFYQPQETKYIIRDGKLVYAKPNMYLAGTENYTTVGTPTIVDNVASGFSIKDYLKANISDTKVYDYEFYAKFSHKVGSTTGTILSYYDGNNAGIFLRTNGTLRWQICRNTSNQDVSMDSSISATEGDTIIAHCYYAGNNVFVFKVSKDNGTTWTENTKTVDITTLRNINNSHPFMFGRALASGYENVFAGSIDLNETYIKVNGNLYFYGKNYSSQNIAPVPSGFTYGTTTTNAIGWVDMRTQEFHPAPAGTGYNEVPSTPTPTPAGIDANTVLMAHFDDNTADASANAITPTTSGTITYGTGKFSKALTGGTLTYSDASLTDITKSTGKFTVDFWMPKIEGCAGTIYFRNSNNSTVFKICRNISGDVLSLTETGVACDIDISGITANEWFHLALVNDGQFDPDNSSYRIFPVYLNGVFQKNLKYSKTNLSGSGKIYTQITTAPIDELRVSDIVRYTGNFTPPTQPYSN